MNKILMMNQDSGVPIQRVDALPSAFIGLLVMVNGFLFKWNGTRYLFEPDLYSDITELASTRLWRGGCYSSVLGEMVFCVSNGDLYSVNMATGAETPFGATFRDYRGLCELPDGSLCVCVNSGSVYKINPATKVFTNLVLATKARLGMNYCASFGKLVATQYNGVTTSIDIMTGAEVTINATIRNYVGGVACDDTYIYLGVDNGIWRMPHATMLQESMNVGSGNVAGLAVNNSDGKLYYNYSNSAIGTGRVSRASPFPFQPLIATSTAKAGIAFGSNGMAYSAINNGKIYRINWTKIPA